MKEHKLIFKFRFITFFGKFYSLKCAATSMNHSAFQWVEITILYQGRVLGWNGNGMEWAVLGCTEVHFASFLFRWIYYYSNNKSTRKESGKMHLCGLSWNWAGHYRKRYNTGNNFTVHLVIISTEPTFE